MTQDVGPETILSTIAWRVFAVNAVLCATGAALWAALSGTNAATAFLAGFFTGALNQYLGFRAVKKAVLKQMEGGDHANPVALTGFFYARFVLTAVMLGAIAYATRLNPWGIISGFVVVTFAAIFTMVLSAKKGL